jgi:hypothetical protein
VDWFPISGVHLVRIVGTDDQRIDLLLIPVDTEDATADLALTMATDGHDPDMAATVGYHSAPVGPPAEAKASRTTKTAPRTAMPTTGPGAASSDVVGRRRIARLSAHGPAE